MNWIDNIKDIKKDKGYSQNGEEAIIAYIFENIKPYKKYFVDFGAGDGFWLSNTRALEEKGWNGLWMDGNNLGNDEVMEEHITAENINDLFKKYKVPQSFGLLSIDIDGNDYWVWEAITYDPAVVVIEMNGCIKEGISKTIVYNPDHTWQHNDYYGASFEALKKLGHAKGYKLIYQHQAVNMFFVKTDLLPSFDDSVISYEHNQYHRKAHHGNWINV